MISGVVATSISGCGVCSVCRVVCDSVVNWNLRTKSISFLRHSYEWHS